MSTPITSPWEGVETHFLCSLLCLLTRTFSTAASTCSVLFQCTLERCIVYVNSHWRIIVMLPECELTCHYGFCAVTLNSRSREYPRKLNRTNRPNCIACSISDWIKEYVSETLFMAWTMSISVSYLLILEHVIVETTFIEQKELSITASCWLYFRLHTTYTSGCQQFCHMTPWFACSHNEKIEIEWSWISTELLRLFVTTPLTQEVPFSLQMKNQ